MGTKAIFAIRAVDSHLDISIPGSAATIHVWWLNVTLVMSAVFGFAEHSLCVAWAATFRGERWIELSNYGGSTVADLRRSLDAARGNSQEPLLAQGAQQPLYP